MKQEKHSKVDGYKRLRKAIEIIENVMRDFNYKVISIDIEKAFDIKTVKGKIDMQLK